MIPSVQIQNIDIRDRNFEIRGKESKWESLKIVGTCTLAAVIFGVANDLLQMHECPEYWAVGHIYGNKYLIDPIQHPILNALAWGTLASWWAGAAAGGVVATASRAPLPDAKRKVEAKQLYRPLAITCAGGLVLGHLVSRLVKHIVRVSIQQGGDFSEIIPKKYPYKPVPLSVQPGLVFLCC